MEHAALHGAQLLGLLLALAAPLLALLVLRPAAGEDPGLPERAVPLARSLARSAFGAAALGAAATAANLFVSVAEIEGRSALGGADPSTVARFATGTTVGRLAVARGILLFVAALLARRIERTRDPLARALPWGRLAAAAAAALLATALVSHAAALPSGRAVAVGGQVVHLAAGAAWIGSVLQLALARRLLAGRGDRASTALASHILRRFTPIALAAAALVALTGARAAWLALGGAGAVATSAWGLTLLWKLALLGPVAAAGWTNWRVVGPGLDRAARDGTSPAGARRSLDRMLELEATAGLLAILVAGILGSVSPPDPSGNGRLSPAQLRAVTTPHLPRTGIVDPSTWVGSATRTDDDLRYSEFMHNGSGLVVVLLGLAWLLQARGGGAAGRVGALWPLALVPFAAFIAIASDPEVWPMGHVPPLEALRDPTVLEHRIGALMVLVLAGLGLREERRGGEDRPLGHALPLLMIVGSLLLLGHAHSSFGTSESLGTLIDWQHAVLGGLGLAAGVVRWLELRGLFPHRVARVLWPSLVIALGAAMAFFYRELA
ncbi:CopD family protein [bacterium]|nr:CopD family protein [bacterium]